MKYQQCAICGLTVPTTLAKPILINNKGRVVKVAVCEVCEEKKKKEAQQKDKK